MVKKQIKKTLDVGAGPRACPDFTKGNHRGLPLQKNLSEGWNIVTLNNICEINPRLDKLKFPSDMAVSFVPMAAVGASDGKIDVSQKRPFYEVKKGFTSFRSGDVLFAKITPCMENGKMAVVPKLVNECGFGSTEFHVLRPNHGTDARYIYYYASCENFRREAAHNMTGAVGQKRVSASYLSEQKIPLPPFDQQKLIVSEIEKHSSRLDEAVAALKRVRASLKRYKASVLKAAVEWKLTEDWRKQNPDVEPADVLLERIKKERSLRGVEQRSKLRGKEEIASPLARNDNLPELPKGWAWATVRALADNIHYGYTASSANDTVGPKLLRITDIQNNTVKWDAVPYCKIQSHEKQKYLLKDGDLVFARTGATVGKSFLIRGNIPEAVFASYLIRIILSKHTDKRFIYNFFQSLAYWMQIHKGKIGIGQPNVNAQTLSQINLPLPPLIEQQKIVEEIESRLSVAEEIETAIETNLKRAERLQQAILKKAFLGELVPADKN